MPGMVVPVPPTACYQEEVYEEVYETATWVYPFSVFERLG